MRKRFLVAYDISDGKRLRDVHREVQAYALGGQKSFYECLAKPSEIVELVATLVSIADPKTDKVHIFELKDPPIFCGTASTPSSEPFMVV